MISEPKFGHKESVLEAYNKRYNPDGILDGVTPRRSWRVKVFIIADIPIRFCRKKYHSTYYTTQNMLSNEKLVVQFSCKFPEKYLAKNS